MSDAWDITTGSSSIRVGIIDSGIDISHLDLRNRVNTELSESFVPGHSALEDAIGHGTHIAGIIGAQGDNDIGIAGVCWNVELVSLRVLGEPNEELSTSDFVSRLTSAIRSANEKGIHILNISLGTSLAIYSDEMQSAIEDFEGLVVCAAGNISVMNDPTANNDIFGYYPANINSDNLITVGASTHADTLWQYSCYGATTVDIFAPGNSILSCYPISPCKEAECDTFSHIGEGYHLMSGTSMAAPHVAGVAALMLSIHHELTAAELKYILMNSVDMVFDDELNNVFIDLCVSGGRLNAYKALTHTSLHNFSTWTSVDAVYHSRTCADCGYTQYQTHAESWNSFKNMCIACKRTGAIGGGSILQIPDEEGTQ